MTNKLFVYGTLRKDLRNSMFHLLAREATFKCTARMRGRLYDLGDYPGLVLDGSGGWVHGEVYELKVPGATLPRLDNYEGCGPDDPEPHEFERVVSAVITDDENVLEVWAYIYKGPTAHQREIKSGDYFEEVSR